MARLERKRDLNQVSIVITDASEHPGAVGLCAMVADVHTVHVPVLVAYAFLLHHPRANPPGFPGVRVETPDAVIHELPGAFMAEGQHVGQRGRRVDVVDPGLFLPDHLCRAADGRDAHDLADRVRLPRVTLAHACAAVDRPSVRVAPG